MTIVMWEIKVFINLLVASIQNQQIIQDFSNYGSVCSFHSNPEDGSFTISFSNTNWRSISFFTDLRTKTLFDAPHRLYQLSVIDVKLPHRCTSIHMDYFEQRILAENSYECVRQLEFD